MLTCNGLLPLLDIEELGLAIYPFELKGLGIYPLGLHLTSDDWALKGHDAKVVAGCSLDDHHVSCLETLSGSVTVYRLARILETDFEIVLVLLLIHPLEPVIDLQLTASLSICTFQLTGFLSFHDTTTGTVVSL